MNRRERRVVVTGIGIVSPLGCGTEKNWEALIAGRSGVGPITLFDASELPVRFAGEVRDLDAGAYFEKKDLKKVDRFTQFSVAAAQMAMDDAELGVTEENAPRIGVIVGVGIGGIATIEDGHRTVLESGVKRLTPFFIPRVIANMAPAHIAMRFGCTGPNYTTTSACASGGHAVGEAYRLVRFGYQDAVIAGGAEAAVTRMGVAGFAVMRALSTRNEEPERASRPFDRGRDGFVMGEGAGILVLESLEHARARGARIYAEIAGYGANGDAYHITMPAPEGRGAAQCMRLALEDGEIDPLHVDYINAHGTSTPYNDANETQAIKRVFGEHAGAGCRQLDEVDDRSPARRRRGDRGRVHGARRARGVLPPTINYEEADPECDLDYVPNRARPAAVRVALSNSFGFGGTNACVAFRRFEEREAERP